MSILGKKDLIMNEYELLGGLHEIIDTDVDNKVKRWLDEHNTNYCLLYPLAMIELGAMKEPPETINNLFKRCVTSFIYSKAISYEKDIYIKKFNIPGLKKNIKEYDDTLVPIFQNYRFSREINDINPITKPQLKELGEHKYQLTTSLVTDKYAEEKFYFYGEDDREKNKKEQEQTAKLHHLFWNKIVLQQVLISELEENVDNELFGECIKIVEKDINKWNSSVKSSVFDNPKQLSMVIAYFYYYAMIRTICVRISTLEDEEYIDNADECIIKFKKDKCIQHISTVTNINTEKVSRMVNYFINDGKVNLLEFPLFEVEDTIVTIPSLFLVNDWQFTVINGHYAKKILITNREKTISAITEGRLENLMHGVINVATAKTVPYSFKGDNDKIQNSDIDFAIYDKTRNAALIIEAKWIDNHYGDEIDKRYGMIFKTLNGIYSKQISKHVKFLGQPESVDYIFKNDSRYCHSEIMPRLFYLAVDKRNQMHIGERHMVSEYMLIYLLKKNIVNEEFNIDSFWDEIESLETKVKYIVSSSEFYEIPVNREVILIEQDDLHWKQ